MTLKTDTNSYRSSCNHGYTIMLKTKTIIISTILLWVTFGCRDSSNSSNPPVSIQSTLPSEPPKPIELTVGAAAGLTLVFKEIKPLFETENNCTLTYSFASAGTLAQQIRNGAPFDLFASAEEKFVEELVSADFLAKDTKTIYAVGKLGLITLKESSIKATSISDLLKPEIRKVAIASPEHAAYGTAAKQAIISAGLWEQLQPKLVYGKNITETLSYVNTHNADAGFISLSLRDDAKQNFTLLDESAYQPIRHAAAVLTSSKQRDLALKFIHFLQTDRGREIMLKFGYIVPN